MDKNKVLFFADEISKKLISKKKGIVMFNALLVLLCLRYSIILILKKIFKRTSTYLYSFFQKRVLVNSIKESQRLTLARDMGLDYTRQGRTENLVIDMLGKIDISSVFKAYESKDFDLFVDLLTKLKKDSGYNFDSLEKKYLPIIKAIPERLIEDGFIGKLARTTAGVVMYCLHNDKKYDFERAIHLGMNFGLLYLYDEVLDSNELVSADEKTRIIEMTSSLLDGNKPKEMPKSQLGCILANSFKEITLLCPPKDYPDVYVLLDLLNVASSEEYDSSGIDEQKIYRNVSIKSAMTRLLPAALAGMEISDTYLKHCLWAGIANQLIDDLRDYPDDKKDNVPTPFVYFSQGKIDVNPIYRYITAVEQSIVNMNSGMKIRFLWSLRMTHGLSVLGKKTLGDISDLPISNIWKLYVKSIWFCRGSVVDLESKLAVLSSRLVGRWLNLQTKDVISH